MHRLTWPLAAVALLLMSACGPTSAPEVERAPDVAAAPETPSAAEAAPAAEAQMPAAAAQEASLACGPGRREPRRCISVFEQASGSVTTIASAIECTVYEPNASGHRCPMECPQPNTCAEIQ